jgi:anaerobic magnesium-protoporphyrin IX monomethyl ester cyclase
MRRLRVLLITPPYHCGMLESAGVWLPLGLLYIAGEIQKQGHEVEIYDAMSLFHDWEAVRKTLEDYQPDIVGTGAITATANDCIALCALAKKINPSTVTILGNVHPTFMWQEIMFMQRSVDFVVRGEGEETFPELVSCLAEGGDPAKVRGLAYLQEGEALSTPERAFIEDLDRLSPAWNLVNWSDYTYHTRPGSKLAIVSSSRGCLSQCLFCSQRLFWRGTWRARSPESFVNELELLRRRFGVDVAMISDEYPTCDRERWEKILDLLIDRDLGMEILMETRVNDILRDEDIIEKYRLSGISHIYVGVESTDQQKLDIFRKNICVEESKRALEIINGADIVSETSFVVGMPDETKESIDRTLELAKFYDPDMAFFLPITPWPYTELHKRYREYVETSDYSCYNLVEPIMKPTDMTRDELRRAIFSATGRFFAYKFSNLERLSPYKRAFMRTVLDLLVERSYLSDEMKAFLLPIMGRTQKGNMSTCRPQL